jgi:hypothetical protein
MELQPYYASQQRFTLAGRMAASGQIWGGMADRLLSAEAVGK